MHTFMVPYTLGAKGLSPWMCEHYGSILVYSFVLSRMTVYIFFILRAFYAFKGSVIQYNPKTIAILIVFAIIWSNIAGITLVYVVETQFVQNIVQNGVGERCLGVPIDQKENAESLLAMLYIFGISMDTFAQLLAAYLLLSKIFQSIFKFKNGTKRFVLLATKQTVLLFIVIISSQILVFFSFFVPSMTEIIFSIDIMINFYCLWLSFAVNDQIYKKYFCGNRLSKWGYPIIKSVAICCYEERNCHCCCCCACLTCDAVKRIKQKETYMNAKHEIELIINGEMATKKITIPDSPVSPVSP